MSVEELLFYVVSVLALIFSAGVVLQVRNTVYAALSLVGSMLCLAGLFVMLHAEFLGVLQVMIYAGAIVVLFLFVLMLLDAREGEMGGERQILMKSLGTLIVVGVSFQLVAQLREFMGPWSELREGFGSVREMGMQLYTDYLLAFEVAGILLLVGIVGALVLAKQRISG
ncbi:MAG: NADH-quinone oxidoreductase subunit J [Myxococcota bacterium]